MTYSDNNTQQPSRQDQESKEFIRYLKVLFSLIEGDSEAGNVRPKLIEFLQKNQVPLEIEAMLKDLFATKFSQEL